MQLAIGLGFASHWLIKREFCQPIIEQSKRSIENQQALTEILLQEALSQECTSVGARNTADKSPPENRPNKKQPCALIKNKNSHYK